MRILLLTFYLVFLSFHTNAQETQPADMFLTGGKIYTGDSENPEVDALAIKDGTIIFAGPATNSGAYIGPNTEIIDLQNLTAFPGFTDSHVHLRDIGKQARSLDLSGARSLASLQKMLRDWRRSKPDTSIITGGGWLETHWPEKRFPSRWDIDAIINDIPVLLYRGDHHALVANTKALEMAGITPATQAPEGGAIVRNILGEATGILIDHAQNLVSGLLPVDRPEDMKNDMIKGAEIMAQNGWTGVHTMGVSTEEALAYDSLSESGDIKIRLYHSLQMQDADMLLTEGARVTPNGKSITRAIKVMLDGALGSRGAALLEPYSDTGGLGLMLTDKEALMPLLQHALRAGIQVNAHAIGDKANRLALDWFEEAFALVPEEERPVLAPRWRIEHAQIISAEDLPRFAALGVIASMQPSHAISDLHFAAARLGETRLATTYRWSSLLATGATIAGGSDAPVEKGSPVIEFYAATARRDLAGFQGPEWHPEEALTRKEALTIFTLGPALASFQEKTLGTLSIGKSADISVFDTDLMTAEEDQLPKTKAALTIVAGEILYKAPMMETEKNAEE